MKIGDIVNYQDTEWVIYDIDSHNSLVFIKKGYLSLKYYTQIACLKFSDLLMDKDSICNHNLKRYEGFTQLYNYCTLCDYKEDLT